MWTRKELKENAKKVMNGNYWRTVLAALIMVFILGNAPKFNFSFDANDFGGFGGSDSITSFDNFGSDLNDTSEAIQDVLDEMGLGDVFDVNIEGGQLNLTTSSEPEVVAAIERIVGPLAVIICSIVLLASILGICFKIFLLNPLEVGGKKFFIENHDNPTASVKNYGHAFKNNYMNSVLVMFLRKLFISLWSLLLVIPGIVKSYEYRMIPYLLAENPNMNYREAFAESKRLMTGNKWNAFVLDLSFIGWHLLNGLTLGILGIFYVNPYVYQTDAELYIRLTRGTVGTIEATEPGYDSYVEVQ